MLMLLGLRYSRDGHGYRCVLLSTPAEPGLALSFDIIGGYTGYINLGHAAFFGIGAYAFGICVNGGVPVLLAAVVAVGCTALLAGLISYPFFRLRGPYYALATFGLLKLCEELRCTVRSHRRVGGL
jgi:branched-chain amino acid transport system permease protein